MRYCNHLQGLNNYFKKLRDNPLRSCNHLQESRELLQETKRRSLRLCVWSRVTGTTTKSVENSLLSYSMRISRTTKILEIAIEFIVPTERFSREIPQILETVLKSIRLPRK